MFISVLPCVYFVLVMSTVEDGGVHRGEKGGGGSYTDQKQKE